MWTPEERARVEQLESLIQRLAAEVRPPMVTASGTIDALGVVTVNRKTPTVGAITANLGANTLTLNLTAPIDTDGIYFTACFVYDPAVGTIAFLPLTQTSTQTVFSGVYPPPGPWNFALMAIGEP